MLRLKHLENMWNQHTVGQFRVDIVCVQSLQIVGHIGIHRHHKSNAVHRFAHCELQ